MLSVIIPARNETYLQKTIENVLENSRGEIEVIAILDGYWPDPPIKDEPRVKLIHHTVAIGQRQSINEAARIARGEFIMKLDAHCAVDEGFDVKLAADCEYNWTVVPRMYNLDVATWKPKLHKLTDYMYIGCSEGRELRAEYYGSKQPKNAKLIDDTMCCMGPGWFMRKDRFWELGGCDENHGGWGQQGVEVALKAWLSGGALKVNKKTWFAHWFRGGGGPGFPYSISGKEVEVARAYSRDLWFNNKWPLQKRKLDWLVDKFNPPGWDSYGEQMVDYFKPFYKHLIRNNTPKWRGVQSIKFASDLILYAQILWDTKPDVLIECGTGFGGSTLFYADFFDIMGHGEVISIDRRNLGNPEHKRITYITGRTTGADTLAKVKELVGNKTCMVILDSDHRRVHVKRELYHYSPLVTSGQFLVVEDIYGAGGVSPNGPGEALDWFLRRNKNFKKENPDQQFVVSITKGGWLRRI